MEHTTQRPSMHGEAPLLGTVQGRSVKKQTMLTRGCYYVGLLRCMCCMNYKSALMLYNIAPLIFFDLFIFLPPYISCSDGALLLGASSLSGRCWLGSVWVYSDPAKAPNEELCKAGVQTATGVTDVKWVSDKGVVVASDSGKRRKPSKPATCLHI